MKLAIEDINNNPDFLPNITLGLDVIGVGTSSAVSYNSQLIEHKLTVFL